MALDNIGDVPSAELARHLTDADTTTAINAFLPLAMLTQTACHEGNERPDATAAKKALTARFVTRCVEGDLYGWNRTTDPGTRAEVIAFMGFLADELALE